MFLVSSIDCLFVMMFLFVSVVGLRLWLVCNTDWCVKQNHCNYVFVAFIAALPSVTSHQKSFGVVDLLAFCSHKSKTALKIICLPFCPPDIILCILCLGCQVALSRFLGAHFMNF